MKEYDFSLEPGKELKVTDYKSESPLISVIIPFYNDFVYIEQSVNCILNQTFPFFELLIIDDGSTDKKSLKKLDEVSKLDKRIKVLHKENAGLAATRDYGAEHASEETKYFLFNDSDDLIEPTYLECAYWTMETNPGAGWVYSDSIGFDAMEYTWNKWFDSNKLKKVNELLSLSLVRKDAYFDVNGYELREKSVNEDWNFWLKLVAKGYYPVHMGYYGQWYRRKDSGELAKAAANRKRSLEIINKTAKTVKQPVEAVQYPRFVYNNEDLIENIKIPVPVKKKYKKKNILMFVPWIVTGGADYFNLELLKRLNYDEYNVTVITSVPNVNTLRQQMEKFVTVYDLTSFIDRKYWVSFINYIIEKENINMIFCTNSMFGYSLMPYLKAKYNIPIIDYVHMEEWYYRDGGFAKMSSDYKDYIDKTLVCNKATENVLKDYFKKDKKEVDTIYIGVDTDKYNPNKYDKKELFSKYGIDGKDKFIISYICRIAGQKRPMLLVKIIEKIISIRKDVLFLIAGDGELLPKFKDSIKKMELESFVVCLGNVSNTAEVYAMSDMTINCSIKEGLALTTYESLSMDVPVVSSDVGGQRELVTNDVGKIVPCLQDETEINNYEYSEEEINNYVDATLYVFDNLSSLRKNCRKSIVEKYTLDQMAVNMMNEFDKLYNKKDVKKSNIKINKSLEYVKDEFNYDIPSSYYLVQEFQRKLYGRAYIDSDGNNNSNYKKELIREKLWQSKLWQNFTKSKIWSFAKRKLKK